MPKINQSNEAGMSRFLSGMKRTSSDSVVISTESIPLKTVANALRMVSHPLPTRAEVGKKTMWVRGGMNFGGRYPDIIIDESDFLRAHALLEQFDDEKCEPSDIVSMVRTTFKTNQIVRFENVNGYPIVKDDEWKKGVDIPSTCFTQRVFECDQTENCSRSKRDFPNTMTNVTALPLLLADCREHAWFGAFLLSVRYLRCNTEMTVSVIYTRSYTVNEESKTIVFLEDHVFILTTDPNGNVQIVDPLYAQDVNTCEACINFNNMKPEFVGISKLRNFQGFDAMLDRMAYPSGLTAPIFRSGQLSIAKKVLPDAYIVSVPYLYDGSTNFIHDRYNDKKELATVLNRQLEIENAETWDKHEGWCTNITTAR